VGSRLPLNRDTGERVNHRLALLLNVGVSKTRARVVFPLLDAGIVALFLQGA
jgi:hypothetical protein